MNWIQQLDTILIFNANILFQQRANASAYNLSALSKSENGMDFKGTQQYLLETFE